MTHTRRPPAKATPEPAVPEQPAISVSVHVTDRYAALALIGSVTEQGGVVTLTFTATSAAQVARLMGEAEPPDSGALDTVQTETETEMGRAARNNGVITGEGGTQLAENALVAGRAAYRWMMENVSPDEFASLKRHWDGRN